MSEGFFLPIWALHQLFFAGLTTDVVDTRYMCPCAQVGGLRPAAAVGPGLSFLTGQRSLPTHSVKTTGRSHLFAVREQSAMSPAANLRAGTKVPISAPSLAKLDYQKTRNISQKVARLSSQACGSRNNVENIATLCNDKVRSSQSTEFLQPVEAAQPNFWVLEQAS